MILRIHNIDNFNTIELMQENKKTSFTINKYDLIGIDTEKTYFINYDIINVIRYNDYINKLVLIKKLSSYESYYYKYLYLKNVLKNNKVVCYE